MPAYTALASRWGVYSLVGRCKEGHRLISLRESVACTSEKQGNSESQSKRESDEIPEGGESQQENQDAASREEKAH